MKNNEINGHYSRLEKSTSVKGDIVSEGDFRIDGTLNGSLKTNGKVVIGKEGSVKGEVTCSNADIEGSITGSLNVTGTLSLRSSSVIEGDVVIGKLIVESGATLNANCSMNKEGNKGEFMLLKKSDDTHEKTA
jgi:cytoskeletal protein CcmA (bactofilin family)